MALLPASASAAADQSFRLDRGDFRWVPLTVRQTPVEIDCHFEVLQGGDTVHAELLPMREFRLFDRGEDHNRLAFTPNSRNGDFRRIVESRGRYAVVIANAKGAAPAIVSLHVETRVNPESSAVARTLAPERRLAVILIGFAFFFVTMAWSGARLIRAMRSS